MNDRPVPSPLEMNDYLKLIMRGVNAQIFSQIGNQIVQGPFKGMSINLDPAWEDGNFSTKLLGCYEFELHETIATAIERKPKTLINVGCADGYYSVGLAMLLPDVRVFAFDVDENSLRDCWYTANVNGVVDRIEFWKGCRSANELSVAAPLDHRLYLLDCEGDELELLDKDKCPALINSDIIVECHDFLRDRASEILAERFANTHDVKLIKPELPPLGRYSFLAEAPAVMALLAVAEKRPMPTRWLACWAHLEEN
jgi:hypothetical protein